MIVPLNEIDFLKRALAAYADKEAVVCGGTRLTYRQLGERVNRWSNAMQALGVGKGDRVGLLSMNCHRMLEAFFGAAQLGVIGMPMNFRLVPDDFLYILNHGGAKILIVEAGLETLIEPIRSALTTVEHFIRAGDGGSAGASPSHPTQPLSHPANYLDYETLLAVAAPASPAPVAIDENEVSSLLYTSGTTGRPKGVMMTHRNLYLNAINTIIEYALRDTDRYLQITAMFHCNGWGLPYAVVGVGATLVTLKRFDPAAVFELIAREQITVCNMAPTMISMCLHHPAAPEFAGLHNAESATAPTHQLTNSPTLRLGTAGSAPPMAVIAEVQRRWGWQVQQVYGLTETSPFLTVSRLQPHMRDWPEPERLRMQTRSGFPMIGVDLRVVDEAGHDVPADGVATGEIIARSNVVTAGYWNQPEATAEAIRDGWFYTGDIGTIDAEGFIEVTDRKKDMIISGAENISSIEVEGVLYQHPAVLEAALVAVPDDQWGEVPHALVVVKPGLELSADALIAFCRERLAHFKCPKTVEFIAALPRTATGKVQKNVLRERYWAGREKRV